MHCGAHVSPNTMDRAQCKLAVHMLLLKVGLEFTAASKRPFWPVRTTNKMGGGGNGDEP